MSKTTTTYARKVNYRYMHATLKEYADMHFGGCYVASEGRMIEVEMPECQRKERQRTAPEISKLFGFVFKGHSIGVPSFVEKNGKLKNVDGGHRARDWHKFFHDELYIPYNGKKVLFSELPKDKQEELSNHEVLIEVSYGNVDEKELFKYKNSCKPVSKMEDLHSDYGTTPVWKLAEELGNNERVNKYLKTGSTDSDNGYRRTESVLQILGMIHHYNENKKNGGNPNPVSKSSCITELLEANLSKTYLDTLARKFRRSARLIDSTYAQCFDINGSKKIGKMHYTNMAYVLNLCIETSDNIRRMTAKLENMDVRANFELKLGSIDPETSKYFISCKGGKTLRPQLESLEKALKAAIN